MELNVLSWLIYFAGITDNLSFFLGTAFFIFLIFFLVTLCVVAVKSFSFESSDPEVQEQIKNAMSAAKRSAVLAVVVALTTSIVPSSKTMYLIAASEMGEQVISTETASKLKKIIDYKLDEIIELHEEIN